MTVSVEVQRVAQGDTPTDEQFAGWAAAAMADHARAAELVIRVAGVDESRTLNRTYRSLDKPTNVLSFPFDAPPEVGTDHLGDLVICAAVVEQEAAQQRKSTDAHWAHMVVHGVLHLLGYDHLTDDDAEEMEAREREVLAGLGYPDPYSEKEL